MLVTAPMMVFIAIGMLGMLISKRNHMRRELLIIQLIVFSALLLFALGKWTHVF